MSDEPRFHTVTILDEDAQVLADLFLPPEGTAVSIRELEDACHRLTEATRAWKRLRAGREPS